MLALGGVVLGGHGQLLQAHQCLAVGAADDVAVHDIHVVYRLTGQRGGECSSSCVLPINTQCKTSCTVHFAATGEWPSFETDQVVHWFLDVVSGYVHRWLEVHT